MSNVRDVIVETMQENGMREYIGRAAPVIEALEARDEEIASDLMEAGARLGASETQVREVLQDTGLLDVPQEEDTTAHTPVEPGSGDVDARLTRMERNIEALMGVARSRGLL